MQLSLISLALTKVYGFASGVSLAQIQALFGASDKGFIYDFKDPTTLFQNSNGTGVVSAATDPIGYATDLSGKGAHATQATAGNRVAYDPDYGAVCSAGKSLTAGTIDPSGSKHLTVVACVQSPSSGDYGLFSHGTFSAGDAYIALNSATGGYYVATLCGSVATAQTVNSRGGTSTSFKVVSALFDRTKTTALEQIISRVNGESYGNSQQAAGADDSSAFGARQVNIFTNYFATFSGKCARMFAIYRQLTANELYAVERWVGAGGGLSLIEEFPPAGASYYSLLNSYGQSLAVGGGPTVSVVSAATRFNDVMFTSGVHVMANGQNFSTLIPLVESTATESATPEGETPISGMAEFLHEAGYANPFIGVVTGFPSLPIANLQLGQPAYNNFKTAVTQGMRRSREEFKHFKVRAFPWMQGESDGTNNNYASDMNTLRSSLNTDIKAITSQTEDVWMLTYQLNRAKIGLAHLSASDTYSNIKVAFPAYFLPHTGDEVHLTSTGYKISGAYFGKAYKEVIVDGNTDWQPLRPVSHSTAGANCDVTFNPVGTLAFDTAIVAAQTNYGFKMYQSDGTTPITISSVALLDTDTVRITASGAIPAGAILRYGISDPEDHSAALKGNLRDSQGDSIVFDGGGLDYPLHNWCVLFTQVIA